MLNFLLFVIWALVFLPPMITSIYTAYVQDEDVSNLRWISNGIWLGVGIIILISFSSVIAIWTSVMWFDEVGYLSVFWTRFWAGFGYALASIPFVAAFFFVNLWATALGLTREQRQETAIVRRIAAIAMTVLTASLAWDIGSNWPILLLAKNQVPFGSVDPVFGKDLSFYIFSLPVLEMIRNASLAVILLTAGCITIVSFVQGGQLDTITSEKILNRLYSHLAILGIFLLTDLAFGTVIAKWNLLYSTRGVVLGAGWTDIHVQLPAYNVYIAGLVLCSIILLASAFAKSKVLTAKLLVAGTGLCALFYIGGVWLVPMLVQEFKVKPSEVSFEQEYIKRDMQFTKTAFGIDDKTLKQSVYPFQDGLTSSNLEKDKVTLKNVRLWDWKILQSTNLQNQSFRNYYAFPDVDVVRYQIDGHPQSMMYSSRELDQDKLPQQAATWVNTKLVYTHGYGGCANPVNTILQPEGLPDYWLKNVPTESKYPALKMTEPRIYFGETKANYVFVDTKMPEFDYPSGEQNVTFKYDGKGGIKLDNWLKKFVFAFTDNDLRILTANELTDQSRILINRDIRTRVENIAPFLYLDRDPYQVIANGKLWYIWDAYTTSNRYPYASEQLTPGSNQCCINYIRNSVKVAIDAYNGSVDFYNFDPNDPIIQAYSKIFPGLFKGKSEMPKSLLAHVRYPQDLLEIQGRTLSTYHMREVNVFYNKEDVWSIATEAHMNSGKLEFEEMEPYYIVMKMPGEEKEEFVQILPFAPRTTDTNQPKNNMVGWLAARCDPEHYGELVLFDFPKGKLVSGPAQIGIRMNQDDIISKDISLWAQKGSEVLFGNLLVIPLSDSRLLYIQPIFIQAENSKMPELKRVLLCSGSQLAYAPTFAEALAKLTGTSSSESVFFAPVPGRTNFSQTPVQLASEAQAHLNRYQEYSSQGRFTEAGKELEALKATLGKLATKK
ncbi:MAG: UPF0182 family protein [Candidatus Berkelbacteria bacterium]|nr:UPF0182 family protein [Candidatus Berkelbacteria bacterium]